MTLGGEFWGLARESLVNPRRAARAVLGLRLQMPVLWQGLALVAILTDLMLFAEVAAGGGTALFLQVMGGNPVAMAGMQFASLVVMVLALHGVGHAFRGKGDWAGAMALVIWLQVIMLGVAAAQVVLYLVAPPLADILGLGALALLLWLLTNFAAELHGFSNLWLVFLGILASGAVLIFGLSFLLVAIGVLVPGVA